MTNSMISPAVLISSTVNTGCQALLEVLVEMLIHFILRTTAVSEIISVHIINEKQSQVMKG